MESKITYHQQMSYCGKARCGKCRTGIGHGPYWYAYQTVNGRVKRTYIGKELPPEAAHLVGTERASTLSFTIPTVSAESLPTGRIHRNPLIGREKERTFLHSLLLQVENFRRNTSSPQKNLADLPLDTLRTSQCVVLLGEAGIGKTRLAEELGREAQQRGWSILWSRVYAQESGIPYRVWTDILRKAFEIDAAPSFSVGETSVETEAVRPLGMPALDEDALYQSFHASDVARSQVAVIAARDAINRPLQVIIPELWVSQSASPSLVSMEPEQEQLRLREAASSLLTTISQKKPLLIVLDDIQWADGSSCELLGYLARHVYKVPILLLATCRSNEASKSLSRMIDHMQREHTIIQLPVEPLTHEEIAQLIEHVPVQQVQRIQIQAAGNPFFAEELARSINTPQLPNSISAALDSRMNSLSNECRMLLRNAAVLGSSFEFPLIHALEVKHVGVHTDEDALFDLLEEAIEAGVLTEEGTAARVTYSFWHPLMVTHLYESVSAIRRTHIHRRVADILLRMYRGRETEVAATIAHHLLHGGAEPVHTAHYAELAGDRAYALLAYSEAEQYYMIALDAMNSAYIDREPDITGPLIALSHRAQLTERLAESVMVQGRFVEARILFERVLTLRFEMLGEDSLSENEAQVQALLWGEIGRTWLYLGDRARAGVYYERGEQVLRETHVLTGFAHARLRVLQGGLLAQEGSYAEALSAAKDALHLFQEANQQQHGPYDSHMLAPSSRIQRTLHGDQNDLGRIYMLLGSVHNSMGQLNSALAHLTTALTMFEERDQKREIANASCNIGYISLKKAEFVLAQNAFERSLAIVKYIGDGPITSVVFSNMGELAAGHGNLEEAENWYKCALNLAEQFRDRTYISMWSAHLAVILQTQHKSEEAVSYIVRALQVGRAIQNILCIGHALLALANIRIMQAQYNGEKRLLAHAHIHAKRILQLPRLDAETHTYGQLVLAHTMFRLGAISEARTRLEEVIEQAHNYSLIVIEQHAQRLLDELKQRQGI
ncbi:MAG: hypothetical protein NVS4B1_14010 [Ktedonobacteraceae bacterium]